MIYNNLLFLGLKENVLLLKQSIKILYFLTIFKRWFATKKPC